MGLAADADETNAARAGRAAAEAWLGDWASAATDAAAVPDNFVFYINMDGTEQAYYNEIFWANALTPYGSYSLDFTWFKDYYTQTGDPRTPWFDDPSFPYAVGSLSGFGQVPWSNQAKYTTGTTTCGSRAAGRCASCRPRPSSSRVSPMRAP